MLGIRNWSMAPPAWCAARFDVGPFVVPDDGWIVGVGYERMLTPNWSLGAEVTYSEYNSFGGTNTKLEDTSAAVRVNYRL